MTSNRGNISHTSSNPNYNLRSRPLVAPIPPFPNAYYRRPMNKKDLNQAVNTPLSPSESSDDSDHDEMTRIRTLKEMAAPDLELQPLCIQYPQREDAFELKSGMIHLLPSFHGLLGEDPNKHLKEFHVVCTSMKPSGTTGRASQVEGFSFLFEGFRQRLALLSTIRDYKHME